MTTTQRPGLPAPLSPPGPAVPWEGVGGPPGHREDPWTFWSALRVVLAVTTLACALGVLAKAPCWGDAWAGEPRYTRLCYSDIPLLYQQRDFATAPNPYDPPPGIEPLEYPVLTAAVIAVTAQITQWVAGDADRATQARVFFGLNVVVLTLAALLTAWALLRLSGRPPTSRPYDALLFAAAPVLVLAAFINWDLIAVALVAVALLAWQRERCWLAGVLLGLAVAAKFYPVVMLGPWVLLAVRAGQARAAGRLVLGAAGAWALVNVPVALAWPDGWSRFYAFSRERWVGFGSPWYAWVRDGHDMTVTELNRWSAGAFLLLCLAIAVLVVAAPRRPRLAPMLLLVVIAFTLTNKVYSPQYVLWLLGLVPLALPRWRPVLAWQAAEVVYFVAIWWHLAGLTWPGTYTVPEWTHTWATVLRMVAQAGLAVLLVWEALRPDRDVLRHPRAGTTVDDPHGGVLDGAPDRWRPARA